VTHDRTEAYNMSAQIAVMDQGRILARKPTKALFADPGSVPAAILTGCKNIAAARKLDEHTVEVPEWGVRLEVAGTTLVGCGTLLRTPLATTAIPDVSLLLVVPDKVVESLRRVAGSAEPAYSYLNIMYRADRAEGDAVLARVLREALPPAGDATPDPTDVDGQYQRCAWPVSNVYTARAMADQAGGLRMVISFLALYIGFVMLVATAAVLAIQQLSEVTDSQGRYRRLRDLGCDQRQIYGSLRTQTVVYFCAPLVLAACHTICAVGVVGGTLFSELGVDPTGLIGVAAGAIVGVYTVYLVATYSLSKSIV
jgi:putative ABC transport system permease protein